MFRVSSEFFTRLPFQAVMCALAGLKPLEDSWTEEAGDRLFDLTRSEADLPEVLECRASHRDQQGVQLVLLRCGQRLRETLAEEHHAVLETIQEQSDFSSDDQDDDFVASDELIEELINVEVLNQAAALTDSSGVEASNKPIIQSEKKKVTKQISPPVPASSQPSPHDLSSVLQ